MRCQGWVLDGFYIDNGNESRKCQRGGRGTVVSRPERGLVGVVNLGYGAATKGVGRRASLVI